MDEEALKAEIRLWALECIVSQLAVMLYVTSGDPHLVMAHRRAALMAKTKTMTFPGHDPAMSDFVASELESAVDRLLVMQEDILENR